MCGGGGRGVLRTGEWRMNVLGGGGGIQTLEFGW